MSDPSSPVRHDLSYWLRPGALTPPAPGDVVLPPLRRLTAAQWVRRVAIWLGLLLGVVLLARVDVMLMRWRYIVLPGEPSGVLQQTLFGLRDFGQCVPITFAMVIVFFTDRRRMSFILALLLAQLLVLAVCHPVKWTVPRYRPYAAIDELAAPLGSPLSGTDGRAHDAGGESPGDQGRVILLTRFGPSDTWIRRGATPLPRSSAYESFPSGHSGAAFAFAAILAWFYPHLRYVFYTLAVGCAASRFIDAVHWPSDCMAGAMIGYAAAWMALRPYAWALPVTWLRRRV